MRAFSEAHEWRSSPSAFAFPPSDYPAGVQFFALIKASEDDGGIAPLPPLPDARQRFVRAVPLFSEIPACSEPQAGIVEQGVNLADPLALVPQNRLRPEYAVIHPIFNQLQADKPSRRQPKRGGLAVVPAKHEPDLILQPSTVAAKALALLNIFLQIRHIALSTKADPFIAAILERQPIVAWAAMLSGACALCACICLFAQKMCQLLFQLLNFLLYAHVISISNPLLAWLACRAFLRLLRGTANLARKSRHWEPFRPSAAPAPMDQARRMPHAQRCFDVQREALPPGTQPERPMLAGVRFHRVPQSSRN
jgi:hypothetical protein